MELNKKRGNDRYANYPVDVQQAAQWRARVNAATRSAAGTYCAPDTAGTEDGSRTENPWEKNLPRRPRRRSRKGLWIFLGMMGLLLAVLIGAAAVWCGEEADSGGENSLLELTKDSTVSIGRTDGGDVRLTFAEADGAALSAKEVYRAVNPATVTVMADHGNGTMSVGTGVIFSEEGYFLTNAHVISGTMGCVILLPDGRTYDALLVGYDAEEDVAVLQAQEAEGLPTAQFGDSELVEVGDQVYAIGNPLGTELRGTLTDGIISAVDRSVRVNGHSLSMLQTNAAINQGNSGGPLINEFGQVIGLNTSKMSAAAGEVVIEGLGFSIPSAHLERLVNQIMEYGETLPGVSLGISVSAVNVDEDGTRGLLVREVTKKSCADEAGIRLGDIILAADGVKTEETNDLLKIRDTHAPGEALVLSVFRSGETVEISVILDEAE